MGVAVPAIRVTCLTLEALPDFFIIESERMYPSPAPPASTRVEGRRPVLHSPSNQEVSRMAEPVVHFEVIGKDPVGLRDFFGKLFGWQFAI